MNNTSGSRWRKWDLHVHTPASALEHSLGSDWDVYVERLIEAATAHDISAIATADYFSLEGYSKLLEYYDQSTQTLTTRGKTASVFIVPGVELRLNIFNSLDDSINLHVFFDPEKCSVEFIKQNFLEELKISYRGATLSLKPQNLHAVGRSIAENTEPDYAFDFTRLAPETNAHYRREALKVIALSYFSLDEALKEIDTIFERKNLPPKTYLVAVVGKGHRSGGYVVSATPIGDATTKITLHPQAAPFLHDPICNRNGCRCNPFRGGVAC